MLLNLTLITDKTILLFLQQLGGYDEGGEQKYINYPDFLNIHLGSYLFVAFIRGLHSNIVCLQFRMLKWT